MFVNFNILNQLGSPAINSNTFANRPAAGQTGRLFVSTDTFEIYRDNGTTWDLIGGPGSSTITGTGQATEVAFFTSSQAIASSANLFWDNTNQYLGIGTSVPNAGVNVQDVDALGVLSNITTFAGTSTSSVSVWAKNTTNSAGYAGIFEEITPNSAAGQYPIKISHTLSSGTAAANMATGIHFGLPDNTGTERINQLSVDTVDPIAATYSNRYRFLLRSNGAAVTPFYITGTGLGVFTATPGAALDIHSTGIMAQLNSTSATANSLMAFQRTGTNVWRLGDQYNGGSNYFELHNTTLASNAIQIAAATNKSILTSIETYSTGVARGNLLDYTLSLPNGTTFTSPNTVTALGATLNLNIAGSATIPAGARSGADFFNGINFTSAGTFTVNQASTIRAFSNVTAGWAFNGSAVGTVTHLAGLRVLFPTNSGSAINVTDNYALLINNQNANTGTITYTNRWGIYQEGASDLNYMAANLLLGSTVNTGDKLQVTGTTYLSSQLTVGNTLYVDTVFNRVGIGTTSPASKLDVVGNSPSIYITDNLGAIAEHGFQFYAAGNGLRGGLTLDYNNAELKHWAGIAVNTYYQTFYTNAVERMRITSGGNVGIGIQADNPIGNGGTFRNLLIGNGAGYGAFQAVSTATASGSTIAAFGGGTTGASGAKNAASINIELDGTSTTNATGRIAFYTGNSAGNIAEKMRITSSGAIVFQGSNTTANLGAAFENSSSLFAIYGTEGAGLTKDILIQSGGSGSAPNMTFKANGNLLIGTTTDAGQKLQVNGVVAAKDNVKITNTNTTSVSTSATTISNINTTYGAIAIVWGSDAGGNIFTDMLFYSLSSVSVISSQGISGGPAGRTYTMNSGDLRLAMNSGTYTIRYQSIITV